jgi:glutamate N-acetyltransferase/amino-acid N-acetyltransferase
MNGREFTMSGISTPRGFGALGINAGIKNDALDMALIYSEVEASIAAVFTTNKIKGAPVKYCMSLLERGETARAIIINSKNANACNGEQGNSDAKRMAEFTAECLRVPDTSVYVCSTGVIGVPLPMDKVERGIKSITREIFECEDCGAIAAKAIMTTDTRPKEFTKTVVIDGKRVKIGAMVKGVGMIEPNMATMLAYITTDANVDRAALQDCIEDVTAKTFNRISVDGDQSCNDSFFIMANGLAGNKELNLQHKDWQIFVDAIHETALYLAKELVRDGEGVTKFVEIVVKGAESNADAGLVARAIGNSLLVKTSWFGNDPNWGRIIDAAGYSGAELVEEKVDIFYGSIECVKGGMVVAGKLAELEAIMRQDEFVITIDLNISDGEYNLYTCDCSYEYVKINAEYTT